MSGRKKVYAVFLGIAVVVSGICYSCTRQKEPLERGILIETTALQTMIESSVEREVVLIYIHVSGEVINPGVYEVPEGARAFEAIERAGGYTEMAARDYINLAKVLQDGEKLVIPNEEEAEELPAESMTGRSVGLININQADQTLLMTLPGVGEAKAIAIIKYRETKGKFERIEDIMKISGIKDAAFEKIKEYITVK